MQQEDQSLSDFYERAPRLRSQYFFNIAADLALVGIARGTEPDGWPSQFGLYYADDIEFVLNLSRMMVDLKAAGTPLVLGVENRG